MNARLWISLLSGVLFALGLGVAGMTQPAKVVGFLDVTGAWDPSLAFVMGGALAVDVALFRFIFQRARPRWDLRFHLPTFSHVDGRLLTGAALFGVGWGLSGYCPGPAVVSLVSGSQAAWTFGLAMMAGMGLFHGAERLRRASVVRSLGTVNTTVGVGTASPPA